MSWRRWLAPVLVALGVAWLVAGGGACGGEASPQLLQVLDVAPREAELGERIAIVGEGFPPGRPARVTFRGTLNRPGERPERDAEVVLVGQVVGPEQIEIVLTEATQALFCGAGDRAVHTTFEGDVEVAFAAAVPGAAPIAGALRRVSFDVRPGATPSDDARDAEGERVLAWIGVKGVAGPSGLLVEAVAPGSRAEAAGIAAGDVVVRAAGVRVATAGDLVPAPGEREVAFGVRRAEGSGETVRSVAVDGFRRAPPADLVGAALIVLAALGVAVLFGAPTAPAIAASLQRRLARLRAQAGPARGAAASSAGVRLRHALVAAARESLPPAGPPAVVDALACALLAALPFGQYLVAAQLDVGLLFVAATTALAVAALLAGRGLWSGVRAAAHVVWQHVPAAAAVASVVLTTGSLRIQEIERAQGGWPWDWLAFRSPAAIVALVLLLAGARIEPDAPPVPGGLAARVEGPDARVRRGPWLEAACRAHRLVLTGLASALFLGGWLLPGLSASEQEARPVLELAGAAWLLVKTWGLATLLAGARLALPRAHMGERTRATLVWLAPASAAALAATAAWTWWSPARPAQLLVSGALVAVTCLVALALAQRVRHALVSASADGRVSPFL